MILFNVDDTLENADWIKQVEARHLKALAYMNQENILKRDDDGTQPRDEKGQWTIGVDSGIQQPTAFRGGWTAVQPSVLGITTKFEGKVVNTDDIPKVTQENLYDKLVHLQVEVDHNKNSMPKQREIAVDAILYTRNALQIARGNIKGWENSVSFLAISKDNIVRGGAVARPVGGNSLQLEYLGSLQHGAGSKLLRQVEDYAISKGFDGIFLNSSKFAANFYEKNGYEREPTQFRSYGSHHKNLTEARTIGKEDAEEPCGILCASDDYIALMQSVRKRDVSDEPRDKDGKWTREDSIHETSVSNPFGLLALRTLNGISENEPVKSLLGKITGVVEAVMPRMNFVHEVGKVMQPVAAEKMKEAHRCYNNSIDVMMDNAFQGPKTEYIEGYTTEHGVPVSHAWNMEDGKPVDHTIPDPAEHQYMGVFIPRRVLIPVASSGLFSKGYGDGILGTIMAMKQNKKRDEYLRLIREANK